MIVIQPHFARATDEPILRLNYGVVFNPIGSVHFGQDMWYHTFQIKLPIKQNHNDIGKCKIGSFKEKCQNFNEVISEINQIQRRTVYQLNETVKIINRIIPAKQQLNQKPSIKTKRAILGFIGSLSRTLFGTATIDDVNILAKHINALTSTTYEISKAIAKHADHDSSYLASVDKRISQVVKEVTENHNQINFMQNSIEFKIKSFAAIMSNLSKAYMKTIETSIDVHEKLNTLKLGIFDLVQGKLSPLLIKPRVLTTTINQIQELLHKQYHGFELVQHNPTYYYSSNNFLYSRKGVNIFILLKMPIIYNQMKNFKLYQVLTYPVPVNDSVHATQLIDTPDYIALSEDSNYYVKMSTLEVNKCHNDKNLQCPINKNMLSSQNACLPSILNNQVKMIKSHCEFRYLHNEIKSQIIHLKQSLVLIYRLDKLYLNCDGKEIEKTGCKFCIISIPCKCSVTADNIYLPPFLNHCHKADKVTTVYPVNLAVMQQFLLWNNFWIFLAIQHLIKYYK